MPDPWETKHRRRRRRMSTPFTNPSIGFGASLIAWYDASQLAFTNGQNVTAWADAGPAANNFATLAGTKTYTSNVQNGLPGVLFSGADNIYAYRDTFTGGAVSQPWWFFLVVTDVALGAADEAFFADRQGATAQIGIKVTTGNAYVTAGTSRDTGIALGTAAHIITFRCQGASSQAWVDGTEATLAGSPGVGAFNGFILGQMQNGTTGPNFYWHEGFLVSGDQSGKRVAAERYLGTKWGITVA